MAQIAVGIKAFFLVSLCSGATASSKNRDLQEFIAIASYQPRTDVSNQVGIKKELCLLKQVFNVVAQLLFHFKEKHSFGSV
jgi:hypothetical protein